MLRPVGEFRNASRSDSASPLDLHVREFTGIVDSKDFPCIYSRVPFTNEEIHFGLLDPGSVEDSAVEMLRELCELIPKQPDAVAVLFLAQDGPEGPDAAEGTSATGAGGRTVADDLELAGRIVRAVMRADAADRPDEARVHPDDPAWMLSLAGVGLFVNFSSPAHRARRSRNVGSAFTVVAQARESFDRYGRSSDRSRAEIRKRLVGYDSVPPHPALGRYGTPDAREALQYFLGDDLAHHDPTGACLRA